MIFKCNQTLYEHFQEMWISTLLKALSRYSILAMTKMLCVLEMWVTSLCSLISKVQRSSSSVSVRCLKSFSRKCFSLQRYHINLWQRSVKLVKVVIEISFVQWDVKHFESKVQFFYFANTAQQLHSIYSAKSTSTLKTAPVAIYCSTSFPFCHDPISQECTNKSWQISFFGRRSFYTTSSGVPWLDIVC